MPRNEDRRVAVTGLGIVSPVGSELESFWQRVVRGETGIKPCSFDSSFDPLEILAAQVEDFDPDAHFPARLMTQLDRNTQFAIVAARSAVADAGLVLDDDERPHAAVIMGTGIGGIGTLEQGYARFYGEHNARLHPLTVPRAMANSCASQISMALGLKGEAFAVSSACASATHAIGTAMRLIKWGEADVVLAGGTEAMIFPTPVRAWRALRVMSEDGCRPFCATRNGMVLGEGAGVLVLEAAERAHRRGARIYGYVDGYGATADAADLTAPQVDGASHAITRALRSAGFAPDSVQYVNAHGTGTRINDAVETQAIRASFGPAADRLMVSSSKAVLGHLMGAAGAAEAVITLLALQRQLVPPTAGWTKADPDCDLDIVPNVARPAAIRRALSNSFAFGGLNAVLALSAREEVVDD